MAKIIEFPGRFGGGKKKEKPPEPEAIDDQPQQEDDVASPGSVVHFRPKTESKMVPPETSQERMSPSGSDFSQLSLLTEIARRGGLEDRMGFLFEGLGYDPEKLNRLTRFRSHITGLSGRGTGTERNIAIRRGLLKEMSTDDLAEIFEGSTETDWTEKPSYYEALVGLLEERAYFNKSVPDDAPKD